MALGTVSSSDSRVYLSTLSGDIYTWDMSNNQFTYQASTGVQLTDIAIAPDGRLFGISYTSLYQIDPNTGQTVYVGPLASPTQLYFGFSAMTSANGFDISPNGTARVSSGNSTWVFEVDLSTGQISAPYAQSLGYRLSAGDIWFTDDTTFAVSTTSYTVEYIAPGSFSEFSVQSDWVGANDLWALFQAPANSTVVAPGTMVGISAGNDTAYNVNSGNFAGLGPGIATFNLGFGQDISGAALHHGATGGGGGGGGGGSSTGFSPVQGSGFDLMDAALLAHAAYALGNDDAENVRWGNLSKPEAYTSHAKLLAASFDPDLSGLSGTNRRGVYTNDNAGALVERKGNDLYVAFTGTNDQVLDLGSNGLNLSDRFIAGAAGFVKTLPVVGALTGFNPLATTASLFVNVGWQFVSADYHHWFHRDQHWALFQELYDEIVAYVDAANIDNIYTTGHSLGAGMVPYFIKALEGEKFDHIVGVQGITFATPGNQMARQPDVIDEDDPRITNYWTDGDIIRVASTFSDTPGQSNKLYTDIKGFYQANNPFQLHDMEIYRTAIEVVTSLGLNNEDFSGATSTVLGLDLDRALLALDKIGPGSYGLNLNGTSASWILAAQQILTGAGTPAVVAGTDQNDNMKLFPYSASGNGGTIFAGLAGDDSITAMTGEADVFVFRSGDGVDTIYNFDVSEDWIDARDFGPTLTPTPQVYQPTPADPQDLQIDFAGQGSIIFDGIDPSLFSSVQIMIDDFVFYS